MIVPNDLHMRPKDDDHMPARHAEPFQVHFRDRTDGEAWTFNLSRRDLAKLVKEGQRLLRRRSTRKVKSRRSKPRYVPRMPGRIGGPCRRCGQGRGQHEPNEECPSESREA